MPPVPFEWSPDYKRIIVSDSVWIWVLFALSVLNMILIIATGNMYVLITRMYYKKGKPLDWDQILCLAYGTAYIALMTIFLVLILRRVREVIFGINSVFQLAEELLRAYRPAEINEDDEYENPTGKDGVGAFTFVASFGLSACPFVLTWFLLFQNWDPLDQALEDLLPDSKYWSYTTILLAFAFRFICCFISLSQGSNLLSVGMVFASALLTNCLHCMVIQEIEDDQDYIDNYTKFCVAFKYLRSALDDIILVLFTASYWAIALAVWFCITGYDKVDFFLYITLFLGTGAGIIAIAAVFNYLREGLETAVDIVENRKSVVNMKVAVAKTRSMRRIAKQVLALQQVQVWYGPFYPITGEYFMEYVYALMGQVVDFLVGFQ
ncbi:unnamed protein product [Orchesella dallaii]|uniref:Gustatory receptor n=1 Tax=Orchesella dallaii TaxID=48710 RepID=A0ABP1RUP0_9HEXA